MQKTKLNEDFIDERDVVRVKFVGFYGSASIPGQHVWNLYPYEKIKYTFKRNQKLTPDERVYIKHHNGTIFWLEDIENRKEI